MTLRRGDMDTMVISEGASSKHISHIQSAYNSSNCRFTVDREFEYMELVSWRGLGRFYGPVGELFGPTRELFGSLGGVPSILWISPTYVRQLFATFGLENPSVEHVDKHACLPFRWIRSWPLNIYELRWICPTQKGRNHVFSDPKWCS